MSGKTIRLFTAILLLAGGAQASAEVAPTENVTVTGTRRTLHEFTKTFATPTMVSGKMARWERRICPLVIGQDSRAANFIAQHIKYVALAAGAPVETNAACTANIEIVFTSTPQELLNSVARDQPSYLGYAMSGTQQKSLATVTRPIQAWYVTETTDVKGRSHLDNGRRIANGNNIITLGSHATEYADLSNSPGQILNLPPYYASTGNRLNDGIHTGFNHVLIVVDTGKLAGQEIVPLSDYLSMLALTQINSLDACQNLPSIVNRMGRACGEVPDSLTKYDLAYLQALYHMTIGRKMVVQRSEIGDLMTDRLETK